jgi:hypothetical protein
MMPIRSKCVDEENNVLKVLPIAQRMRLSRQEGPSIVVEYSTISSVEEMDYSTVCSFFSYERLAAGF